ncbi:hypothetical protein DFH29DRAFT_1071808 [Suillus ampliporus]|nr:hypothetical protein DFH29DRAFT_1071808 [Suillus ampliporus]
MSLKRCKAEKKIFSPNYVREMEDVWHMHTQASSKSLSGLGTVALLLSESKFTTATLTRALSSTVPFILMHLPPPTSPVPDPCAENALGEVGSAFWNPVLVVRMVYFTGNLMFDGNMTLLGVVDLACGVMARGCRTGRRMLAVSALSFRISMNN